MSKSQRFKEPAGVKDLETGTQFTPRFDDKGVLPAIATDAQSGEVLMLAYMNAEALALTIASGEAHYWSRSRSKLWRKGETSGNVQRVVEIRTDCDQDTIWLKVEMAGKKAACHVGYRSCFYRSVPLGQEGPDMVLDFGSETPRFKPDEVYRKEGG